MSSRLELLKIKLQKERERKQIHKPKSIPKETLPVSEILDVQIPVTTDKPITKVRFGCHVSVQHGLKQAAEYTKSLNFNCFQLFLQSPRSAKESTKPFDLEDAKNANQYMKDNDIEMWIHCSYVINFCRRCTEDTEILRQSVIRDMKKAIILGAKGCVLHVGKVRCTDITVSVEKGLENFKQNLETCITELLKDNPPLVPWLLIETAAGQGSETPVNIEGLSKLYNSIDERYRKYIGFCIDTCHVFASGECNFKNTDDIDKFVERWNQHIGWDKVKLIHYNDSIGDFCCKVDRHEEVGKGAIGEMGLNYFKNLCILTGKSIVTEW